MAIDRDQLLEDLKRLRRGRGLAGLELHSLTPSLHAVSGAGPDATPDEVMERLRLELARLTDSLPQELREFAMVALNIGWAEKGTAELPLAQRIDQLAERRSRDSRTVRRHIDEAMNQLADAAIAEEYWAETGRQESAAEWYIKSSRAILRMDLPSPEAMDEREIVVLGSPLGGISLPFTLPRHPDDHSDSHQLQTEMLFGGKFVVTQRVSDSRFDIRIQFPRVLQPGEAHRYAIINRVPDGQRMAPRYVFVPYRRCDEFELLVRFSEHAVPADVRRVTAAFHREIDERQPDTQIIHPDSAGEVRLRFTNLRVGFGYGLQWSDDSREGGEDRDSTP
jgi:hypothetical protein